MLSPYLKHAVDRLFDRLSAVYGRDFTAKFDGVTVDAVKTAWANELRGFEKQFDAVSWALDNLPERCPNAVQFKLLCRRAPTEAAAALPSNAKLRGPTPEERAKLRAMAADIRRGTLFAKPGRQWAYDLIACHEAGWRNGQVFRSTPAALEMARDAIATDPNRSGRSGELDDFQEAA